MSVCRTCGTGDFVRAASGILLILSFAAVITPFFLPLRLLVDCDIITLNVYYTLCVLDP
jgi:hypothetical protein